MRLVAAAATVVYTSRVAALVGQKSALARRNYTYCHVALHYSSPKWFS